MSSRVLVSGAGFHAHSVIKEARAFDRNTFIGCTSSLPEDICRYFADRFFVVPPADDKAFVASMQKIVEEHQFEYLVPSTIYDLEVLAADRTEFEQLGCQVLVSSTETLRLFLDKELTYTVLADNHIATLRPIPYQELATQLPVIGKPRASWGGKGIEIVRSKEALLDLPDAEKYVWTSLLAQFTEYSVDVAFHQQQASVPIIRVRARTTGGFSVISDEVAPTAAVASTINKAIDLIAKLGGIGFFNIQVIETTEGHYVTDINPRIGTSSIHGAYGPNSLFGHATGLIHGAAVEPPRKKKIVRYLDEKPIFHLSLTSVKHLIFDLDDTLLPLRHWVVEKLRYLHRLERWFTGPEAEFLNTANCLIDEGKGPQLIDELMKAHEVSRHHRDDIIEAYRDFMPERTALFADSVDVLKWLGDRYVISILTDNPYRTQKQKLALAPALEKLVDHVIYTDQLGVLKPSMAAFQAAVDAASVPIERSVVIGDHFVRDVLGGIKAGAAHSFFVNRPNSWFSFSPSHYHQSETERAQITEIGSLSELRHYL